MEPYQPDNEFLLRWLDGQLSEEELGRWQGSESHRRWQAVQAALERGAPPPVDKEAALERLLAARAARARRRTLRRRVLWVGGIAAAIAGLAVLLWLFRPAPEWETGLAAKEAITLPDGSEVQLNADSYLRYEDSRWGPARKVRLEGEAYFSVTKGGAFEVSTALGDVRVLGTRFNVYARGQRFEVACQEGKVLVLTDTRRDTLLPGQGLKKTETVTDTFTTEPASPSWTEGQSSFRSAPLPEVFREMERQYGIQVQAPGLPGRTFTGRFPHDNLEVALQAVCGAMGLEYAILDEGKVQITE
ncbi:MAG: FecR family protein [Phaeodactylibacter sp.]|nr:FecR family protein [Phaeodactylibacter sp.]